MIIGTGIDIAEIERIQSADMRQPRFAERILTEKELERYSAYTGRRRAEFLAGRFAAKEAFSKAYGTGIGAELSFRSIEVGQNSAGKPAILKPISEGVHLSISHSKEYVVAQVIIEA